MSDRPNNQKGGGQRQSPRRDPNEIAAHVRNRDRTDIAAHVRNQDRAAIDQHLKDRERNAAARERTLAEAQTRSRARAAGDAPSYLQKKPRSRNRWAIIIASVITALLVAAVVVPPIAQGFFRSLADANPDLMRIGLISDAVSSSIGDRPDTPAGTDPTMVQFDIAQGESGSEIAQDLVNRGLLTDRLAFTYVLVTDGGINNLQAGSHMLNRTMTPREIATALQGQPAVTGDTVQVALREGLRMEQVIAYLETLPFTNFDAEEFYTLAADPSAELKQKFPWLDVIPAGQSVEGFLGSGVYDIPIDADAQTVLETLLQGWQDSGAYPLMQQAQSQGKDFYQTVILASIVEREAIHDSDKPLVAGVYQNRINGLGGDRTLNSDPVLIYAKDTMNLRDLHITQWPDYVFWTYDGISSAADFEVDPDLESYQVWHSRGLPIGPIASPGVASLQAALNPDTQDGYLYFLGKNDGSGDLVFAKTYAQHLQNIQFYLGGSPGPSDVPSFGVPENQPTESTR